jgi:hypothetical protein
MRPVDHDTTHIKLIQSSHVVHGLCWHHVLQEVHDALSSIEAEAERMYASERGLMDADSQSRDRLYQRAQQVGTPLVQLMQQHSNRLAVAFLMLIDRPSAGMRGLYMYRSQWWS